MDRINQFNTIPFCIPLAMNTPNTTLFTANDPSAISVTVAEAVWNNPDDPMKRPNAVILARGDGINYQDALISMPLVHFPRNGPVLLTENQRLTPIVAEALRQFNPSGKNSPAQVIIVGSLSLQIDKDVQSLGFSIKRISGPDPAATAVLIWQVLGPRKSVILTSGETFEEALPAGGWSAHMSTPILLSCRDYLPVATAQAIRENQPDVYILGSRKTISNQVERMARELTGGFVERIDGRDPFEIVVNFTRYKSPSGDFGWGIREKRGWSFRLSRYDDWASALSGAPLSHMGKHSPLLVIQPDAIPEVVREYILSVNPIHKEPEPPFMHGYIVGFTGTITCNVQRELDSLLETVRGH
jgi:putative cell wall-binding protein